LRVGNLLNYCENHVYVLGMSPCTSFMAPSHTLHLGYYKSSVGFERKEWDENLSPISITKGWLEKLDFEPEYGVEEGKYKDATAYQNCNHERGCKQVLLMKDGRCFFDLGGMCPISPIHDTWEYNCVEIKYVHQLQNLFYALTGEDLQISTKEKSPNQ
jgi:hypothetical protein